MFVGVPVADGVTVPLGVFVCVKVGVDVPVDDAVGDCVDVWLGVALTAMTRTSPTPTVSMANGIPTTMVIPSLDRASVAP